MLQDKGVKDCKNTLSQHTVYTCALGQAVCHYRESVAQSVISYIIPNCCCFSWVRRFSLLQHVIRCLRKLPWVCTLGRSTFWRPTSSLFSWWSSIAMSLTAATYSNTGRSCVRLVRPSPSSFLRHRRLVAAAVAAAVF